jgi:hypothetical protein
MLTSPTSLLLSVNDTEPFLIDLPVAFVVLWTRYGLTIVAVVAVVSVI